MRVTFRRALMAPLVPLLLLMAGVTLGLDQGAQVLLLLALLVVGGIAIMAVASPGVVVRDGRLSVPRRENFRRSPGGQVDLRQLVRATSVSYQGGRVSGRGLALFRSHIWLEDDAGGQAMFLAWGWSPKSPFRSVLRDAIVTANAQTDGMTVRRLGLRAT